MALTDVEQRRIGVARVEPGGVNGMPARVAGDAMLVAYPAHIGSGITKDAGVWLQFTHQRKGFVPLVVGGVVDGAFFVAAPIIAIAPIGAIKPHLKQWAIIAEQFTQLIAVVGQVGWRAVVGVVAVPGRQVDAEFEPGGCAGLGELGNHVSLPVPPRTIFDRMRGVLRWPQTKAVVVLGGEDEPLHAAAAGGVDDLGGTEIARVEDIRGFVAQPPFAVAKGVDGEVQEPIKLMGVPGLLARRRHRAMGA